MDSACNYFRARESFPVLAVLLVQSRHHWADEASHHCFAIDSGRGVVLDSQQQGGDLRPGMADSPVVMFQQLVGGGGGGWTQQDGDKQRVSTQSMVRDGLGEGQPLDHTQQLRHSQKHECAEERKLGKMTS